MSENDFDMPEEPSVESADPNERKLARRLRIQRRVDALKKQEGAEHEGTDESTLTEKQIENSTVLLEKLIVEGGEVITNVRVANDAREVYRREEDVVIRNGLLKNLEDEANESLEKYHAINERWSGFLASKDPLDIHAGIQSQNADCAEILERKDGIIAELKQELENADKKFFADQKKQCEDINLLIERIDNQVNTIAKAYRRELAHIDEVLESERSTLLESVTKRWDALYKQRHEEDVAGVDQRKEIMKEFAKDIKRVQIDLQEKYRAEKIELERECQNLQLEVERIKTVCMMNVEKLDYSYAVLKRREDENTIIKSQQKRRTNKLQDVVNSLKKNYNDLEENTRLEIEKLSDQVLKAHKNISELEAKSSLFTSVNEKQYFDIWDMNTETANELIQKILTADRTIHEQTLGLVWEPPELPLLEKEDLPSYNKAIPELQQRKTGVDFTMKILEPHKTLSTLEATNLERQLLNRILKQISDHSGFLVEDRLRELLAPHTFNDNIIIRLDNVFQALCIKSEDQVDLLLNFFLPYSYCAACAAEEETGSIASVTKEETSSEEPAARIISSEGSRRQERLRDEDDQHEKNLHEISEGDRCQLDTDSSGDHSLASNEVASADTARNIESRVTSAPERSTEHTSTLPRRSVTCKKGHLLEIESANVTKALKEYVQKYHRCELSKDQPFRNKLAKDKASLSRSLTNEDVTKYWKRYREIFSQKKEKLWDGLLVGLHKYHEILKERQKLNCETDCLRGQNEELRRLLETYMPGNNSLPLEPRSSNKSA